MNMSGNGRTMMQAVPLLVLTLAACGDSSFVLKPPLMAGCQRAALPKCSELSDAVIAYVDGDKEKAEAKIRGAIVGAAPAKVQLLIKALKELDNLPGSDKFMGPVHDVIAMLDGKSVSPVRPAPRAAPGANDAPDTPSVPSGVEAWTRLRASTDLIIGNSQTKSCAALSYAGSAPIVGTVRRNPQ